MSQIRVAGGAPGARAVEDDALWIEQLTRGDRDALARLYDRYAPLLLGLGVRMLGQRREAEDLVHDVFLEAWRQAHTYDRARGNVRSWLVMRFRSRALDRLKSVAVSRHTSLDHAGARLGKAMVAADAGDAAAATVGSSLVAQASSPQSSPERAPDHDKVRSALARLPADHREVIELGYFEGLSSLEIAERIRIPIGTVKSRVAAALAKLRVEMSVTRGDLA